MLKPFLAAESACKLPDFQWRSIDIEQWDSPSVFQNVNGDFQGRISTEVAVMLTESHVICAETR